MLAPQGNIFDCMNSWSKHGEEILNYCSLAKFEHIFLLSSKVKHRKRFIDSSQRSYIQDYYRTN